MITAHATIYDITTVNDRDKAVVRLRIYDDGSFKSTRFLLFPLPTSIREIHESVAIRTRADEVLVQENLLIYIPFAR